jgi:hypothetical protein
VKLVKQIVEFAFGIQDERVGGIDGAVEIRIKPDQLRQLFF